MNATPPLPTYQDILDAAERMKGYLVHTPLLESPLLNEKLGCRLLVKPECLQPVGSFKCRGALSKLTRLKQETDKRAVVAWSSGNHAQGVSWAAQTLGFKATIVMPEDAPTIKIENTKGYGATIVPYDRFKESREEIGHRVAAETGAPLIPPYDDVDVIAGQGTAGLEIAEDLQKKI